MVNRGIDLLTRFRTLVDSGTALIPDELMLTLPPCGGTLGWIWLLYDTAVNDPTPFLRLKLNAWNQTGQSASYDPDSHPFYQELSQNLFQSSAEAIDVWLDPFQQYVLICLPPEPLTNGPHPPDQFWLHGTKYDGFA